MKYRWVEITFYSFPFTQKHIAAARQGNIEPMKKKWRALGESNNPFTDADLSAARKDNREALDRKSKARLKQAEEYNKGWASIQLATDEKLRVKTVNLSVPGNTCTVAILEPDLKKFLQVYQFDGKQLRLKSNGSYVSPIRR
jgi:hypothetical protein